MPKDKELEVSAKRRGEAVEKNKQILINIIELNEECKTNVREIQSLLKRLSAIRDDFDFYLDKALMSTSLSENINVELRSKFLFELRGEISKLIEIDSFLSGRVYTQSGALQRMSVLLEIESKDTQEAYKRLAESLNISFDESEELWLQILLAKIDEHFEKHRHKADNK